MKAKKTVHTCSKCGQQVYASMGRSFQTVYLNGLADGAGTHKHPEGYTVIDKEEEVELD